MKKEELEKKSKRERIEICLNCEKFVECNDVGKFEVCSEFVEVEDEKQVVIVSLGEYARLKDKEKNY